MGATSPPLQSYRRGALYVVAAGILLSTSGALVRFIGDADAWSVLFYRSFAFFATVIVFMLMRDGRGINAHFRDLRLSDLVVSISLAFGFIFYILSLFNTSVANTVLLLSTGPFIAALLGFVILRESVSISTWVAMLVAGGGVFIMISGDLHSQDITGMAYAVMAVTAFAVMIVALRSKGPERDMLAATSLAGLFAALFCVPFLVTLSISLPDLLLSLCLGSIQVGFGFILITLASASVPSAQIPLFALSETALAPIWVWLLVNEIPQVNTLAGGALVLAAVTFAGIASARSEATGVNAPSRDRKHA